MTKKEVIEEVVDRVMEKYGHYLIKNPSTDIETLLNVIDFVKAQAELEYDHSMVLVQMINNKQLPKADKALEFKEAMTQNMLELGQTLQQNQSEISARTPKNWKNLDVSAEGSEEEVEKELDEDEELYMIEQMVSSAESYDDEEENNNYYKSQEEIYRDLRAKIIAPLTKKEINVTLMERNPLLSIDAQSTPSKKPATKTMVKKRDKMIKEVVDGVMATYKDSLAVDEAFARTYLTKVVSQQMNQVADSITTKMIRKDYKKQEWINTTQKQIKAEITELTSELSNHIERSADMHDKLESEVAQANEDEKSQLELKKNATFLIDIVAPMAQIELLAELDKLSLSLEEIVKEATVIPNYPPPKPPADTAKKRTRETQSPVIPKAYKGAQQAAEKAVEASKASADPSENKRVKKQ